MADGVRRLGPVLGLEVRDEVKRAAVIAPVARSAERDDAQRVIAPAETPRHEMRWIDPC